MIPSLSTAGDGAANAEIEALQTDIMRFFAIVCLCLLAIFAAVSGTPGSAESALRGQVQSLSSDLSREQEKRTALQAELGDVQMQLTRLRKSQNLERQLALRAEAQRVNAASRSIPETTASQQDSPTIAPVGQAAQQEEREGFSLSFADDDAFERLLNTPKLRLIAASGARAWSIGFDRGRAHVKSAAGLSSYPLAAGTVPEKILKIAERAIGQSVEHWSVWLDPALEVELNQKMQQRSAGDLVLQGNGAIEFRE